MRVNCAQPLAQFIWMAGWLAGKGGGLFYVHFFTKQFNNYYDYCFFFFFFSTSFLLSFKIYTQFPNTFKIKYATLTSPFFTLFTIFFVCPLLSCNALFFITHCTFDHKTSNHTKFSEIFFCNFLEVLNLNNNLRLFIWFVNFFRSHRFTTYRTNKVLPYLKRMTRTIRFLQSFGFLFYSQNMSSVVRWLGFFRPAFLITCFCLHLICWWDFWKNFLKIFLHNWNFLQFMVDYKKCTKNPIR